MSTQRPSRIVYSTLDVKHWMQAPPSIDAARPGSCPSCGAASRPPGCTLGLHGHGLRTRQLRGPVAVDGPSTTQVLTCRRYRCTRCRIVLTVVPRGVARHRHYGTAAIALAFALWMFAAHSATAVRRRVCAWPIQGLATHGWRTLRRWAAAARAVHGGGTLQEAAARAAQHAASYAPPTIAGPRWALAYAGGAAMA